MATCTAPEHPTCTITCKNGCAAYWSAKQGCVTKCYKNFDAPFVIGEDEVFSLELNELPASAVAEMFNVHMSDDLKKRLSGSTTTLHVSLSDVTLKDLVQRIDELI
jgi:hypothetical protein